MRNFLTFVFISFMFYSQMNAQELFFPKTNLSEIFQTIEKRTGFKFNYNPEAVSDYFFTGKVTLSDPHQMMNTLLRKIPLSYEINELLILIKLPEPKFDLCVEIKNMNGRPIEGASVYLENSNIGGTSNKEGVLNLRVKNSKNKKVIISYLGYESIEIETNKFAESDCLKINLKESSFQLDLITIDYILKGISEGKNYSSININSKTLLNENSIQDLDVLRISQLLPGVNSIDESASNITIRGSTSDQNLVTLDGITLYNPSHILGLTSSINPFIVDKINIHRSAFNPTYENRIGGVIDISLPNKMTNSFEGGVGTTLADSHAYFSIPMVKNKLSMLLSKRHVTNKYFNSPIINSYSQKIFSTTIIGEENSTSAIGFKKGDEQLFFSDFNAKILYKPSKNVSLNTSYFRSKDDINFISNLAGDDLASNESVFSQTEGFSSKLKIDWNTHFSSQLFVSNSDYQNKNNSLLTNNSENGFSIDNNSSNNVKDFKLSYINSIKLTPAFNVSLGYSLNILNVDYAFNQNSNSDLDIATTDNSKGTFHNLITSFSWRKDKFSLEAGSRNTYYKQFNKWYFSPRLNFQYRLNDLYKFKFSSGIFHQFVKQLEVVGNQTVNAQNNLWILPNNRSIKQLNSKKVSTGFIYQSNGWLLDMEAYYHQINGISSLSTFSGSDSFSDGTGKSDVVGIDFLLKKKWENYNLWLNYTYSKNRYSIPSSNFDRFPANIDQPHNLSIFNTYKFSKWGVSLTYSFKSGLPFSSPVGIETISSENNQNQLIFDRINSKRLPFYSRLDIGASYKTKIAHEKATFEVSLSILNILNRKNTSSRDFFIGDTESSTNFQINSIQRFQLKRTPQLLLRIHW